MGKKLFIGGFAVFVALFMLLGSSGLAQAAIVHCGRIGPDATEAEKRACTTCDILVLGKNIIDFALKTAVPVAAILFLWAGFLILLSGARPSWISKGRDVFRYTVIGLFIMFGAWLVANTVIKSLANGEITFTDWSKIQCQETVRAGGGTTGGGRGTTPLCRNPQALAGEYNTRYPRGNAVELETLISCIKNKISDSLGSVSTFEETNELCNYTRGNPVCGVCAHKVNSCHYGGVNGNQGALAVDFGNEGMGNQIIKAALDCGAGFAECENSSGARVNCTNPTAKHVHVSVESCSGN